MSSSPEVLSNWYLAHRLSIQINVLCRDHYTKSLKTFGLVCFYLSIFRCKCISTKLSQLFATSFHTDNLKSLICKNYYKKIFVSVQVYVYRFLMITKSISLGMMMYTTKHISLRRISWIKQIDTLDYLTVMGSIPIWQCCINYSNRCR